MSESVISEYQTCIGEWVPGWVGEWPSECLNEWLGDWLTEWFGKWVGGVMTYWPVSLNNILSGWLCQGWVTRVNVRLWVTHWSSKSEIWETEQAWVRLIHLVSPTQTLTKLDTHSPGQTPRFPIAHTVRHSVCQAFTQALIHSVRHLLTQSLIHQSYTPIHPVRHSVIQSLTRSHSVRDLVTHSWSQPDAYYTGRHSLTHSDIHSPNPPSSHSLTQ